MSAESSVMIAQANQNGLRPEEELFSNVPYLERMKNLVPSPMGAVYPDPITKAVDVTNSGFTATESTFAFPYPQCAKENLLELTFGASHVYSSTPANIPTYNPQTPASTKAITSTGKVWHWAIMKNDTWFATNTGSLVWHIRTNTSEKTYAWGDLKINSLCEDNNRLYMGGISNNTNTWTTDARFQSLITRWIQVRGADVLADEDTVWGTNWLFYGEAAGGASDIPYYLQMVALGIYGTAEFDKYKSFLFKLIEDGKMGFVPMRNTGEILVVKMLGARVVAYGVDGVSVFGRSEDGSTREWSVKKDIGISARGVVAGNRDKHVFIDSNRNLWHFNENAAAPEYDGFSEFMPDMSVSSGSSSFAGYIDHADWATQGEPEAFCAITQTNTIMAIDSGYIKEFDFDGNLTRRVSISYTGTISKITSDGTYVAYGEGTGVVLRNYSDLSLISDTNVLPTSSGGDSSPRVWILAGGFLFLGFNKTVYKYTLPGLSLSASVAHSSIGGDITGGCYDGTNLVWTVAYTGDKMFKTNTSCVLVGSYVATQYPRTQSIGYSSGLGYYIVQSDIVGTGANKWAFYDTNLAYVSDIEVPVYYEAASHVAALGSRLYLADRYDPQTHIIMMDFNETTDKVIISYDCLRKEFWISSSAGSYVYTYDGKLGGEMDWVVTSLFRDETNALSGFYYDNLEGDREVWIRTVPVSFTERGEKQMIEYCVESLGLNTRRARVAWRVDSLQDFKNSPWVPLSPQGVAFPICSFVDGKIELKGNVTANSKAAIQSIKARYISTDLRFRRGQDSRIEAL